MTTPKLLKTYQWVKAPLIASAPMRMIALAKLAVEVSKAGTMTLDAIQIVQLNVIKRRYWFHRIRKRPVQPRTASLRKSISLQRSRSPNQPFTRWCWLSQLGRCFGCYPATAKKVQARSYMALCTSRFGEPRYLDH